MGESKVVLSAGLAVASAGCGGAPGRHVASLTSTGPSGTQYRAAMLGYARGLRAHGRACKSRLLP